MGYQTVSIAPALQDFREARRQAALQEVMSRITGASTKLLSFDDVSQKLKTEGRVDKGIQQIPLDAIIGSCGRHEDFTRTFLPLRESDKERWAQVRLHVSKTGLANLAPILVYQIGQGYFVLDGNHRVSVARKIGATHIRAHVTELKTKVSLSPFDQPDDLILKAEYSAFLEKSNLDVSRPETDLRVTAPGKYWILEAQIEAHRFLVSGEATYQKAAVFWHDGVYQSVVQVIRDRNLLQDFPERTETDLYLWIFEHRAVLKQNITWNITPHELLTNLAVKYRPKTLMLKSSGRNSLVYREPKALTGQWRREKMLMPEQSRLFFNVLVAVTGQAEGWQALAQAFEIARREHGQVLGLHLVANERDIDAPNSRVLRDEFNRRCRAANLAGSLTIEAGPAVDRICQRAGLADLVVAPLLNPPGSRLLGRISSDFRTLIQRCARPVLAVPEKPSLFSKILLAYDGNAKAKEALYAATYIAGQWNIPLVVLTVAEVGADEKVLQTDAQHYLEKQNVAASLIHKSGPVGEKILETAESCGADLIIMGGYGRSKLKNLILGHSVDQVLRESKQAMLICR
ncbi:MAG: hypothetical protein FOGNACKC_05600 [Anaerolineae bacterium]|nr:hypothetical protein [Anaerolineae bacterium]